jgi:hypothetical protein
MAAWIRSREGDWPEVRHTLSVAHSLERAGPVGGTLAGGGTSRLATTPRLQADGIWAGPCSGTRTGGDRCRTRGSLGMNVSPGCWRRWAVELAQHASWVLPGARSPWAEAMRRELDYIEDDAAALRWAVGCVLASYKARLARLPRMRGRVGRGAVLRHAATSGAVMLVIGLALLENAGGHTEPPRPVVNETTCDRPNVSPDIDPTPSSGMVAIPRDIDHSPPKPDASCADRSEPIRFPPKYQTP